ARGLGTWSSSLPPVRIGSGSGWSRTRRVVTEYGGGPGGCEAARDVGVDAAALAGGDLGAAEPGAGLAVELLRQLVALGAIAGADAHGDGPGGDPRRNRERDVVGEVELERLTGVSEEARVPRGRVPRGPHRFADDGDLPAQDPLVGRGSAHAVGLLRVVLVVV